MAVTLAPLRATTLNSLVFAAQRLDTRRSVSAERLWALLIRFEGSTEFSAPGHLIILPSQHSTPILADTVEVVLVDTWTSQLEEVRCQQSYS